MRFERPGANWRVLFPDGRDFLFLERIALDSGYRICEVCQELECSERYLYEVSKRDLGLPPKLWMRWVRMVRARHMLSDGAEPAEVAEALGFSTMGSFRREFRAVYGCFPGSM